MMTVGSWKLEEGPSVGSLLVKGGMLGIGVAAVWWTGWAQPNSQHSIRLSLPAVADTLVSSQPSSAPTTTISTVKALSHSVVEVEEGQLQLTDRISLINLNLGSRRELDSLPGIGGVLADRIVSYRNIHGAFQQIKDLVKVNGIGEKRFQRIEPYVTIQPGLEG